MKAKNSYARYVAKIQSSGTGKSRTQDQVAKSILYIPINLASENAQGAFLCLWIQIFLPSFVLAYPPPDGKVREWFRAPVKNKYELRDRCDAFLHALLSQTHKKLTDIIELLSTSLQDQGPERLRKLASTFRDKMGEGGEFESHGPYRSAFYDDVIRQAESVSWKSFFYRDQWFSNVLENLRVKNTSKSSNGISELREQSGRWLAYNHYFYWGLDFY